MKTLTNFIIVLLVIVFAWFVETIANTYWHYALFSDRTFSGWAGALRVPVLLSWIPTMIIYSLVGYVVFRVSKNCLPIYSLVFAALLSIILRTFTSSIGFGEAARFIDIVLGYARFLLPGVFIVVAGYLFLSRHRKLTSHLRRTP